MLCCWFKLVCECECECERECVLDNHSMLNSVSICLQDIDLIPSSYVCGCDLYIYLALSRLRIKFSERPTYIS